MKNKNTSNHNITSKIRSSLVIKLNFKMMGRFFFGFLKMNILIILLGFFVILWNGERRAEGFVREIERYPENYRYYFYDDFRVSKTLVSKGGHVLPHSISKRLPVNIEGTKRDLVVEKDDPNLGLLEKIDFLKYTVEFRLEGSTYLIEYYLGKNLRTFFNLFMIILVFQFFILLGDIRKGHRMIRKTLKPIDELTEESTDGNENKQRQVYKRLGRED